MGAYTLISFYLAPTGQLTMNYNCPNGLGSIFDYNVDCPVLSLTPVLEAYAGITSLLSATHHCSAHSE